jgi:hypothetical protein
MTTADEFNNLADKPNEDGYCWCVHDGDIARAQEALREAAKLADENARLRRESAFRGTATKVLGEKLSQAEATIAKVKQARGNHPACDVHPDDDPVTCGWKRAVLDIDAALAHDTEAGKSA